MQHETAKGKRLLSVVGWMLIDLCLVNLALILSQLVRYSVDLQQMVFFRVSFRLMPAMSVIFLCCFAAFGLYRIMWQYSSAGDTLRIAFAALVATLLTFGFSLIANKLFSDGENLFRLHRMVYLLQWIISYALVATSRLLYNLIVTKKRTNRLRITSEDICRVMVIGAGWCGAGLVHDMQNGSYGNRVPVVVLDDDRSRIGTRLNGVPVVRGSGNILKLTSTYHIDEIVIAVATPKEDLSLLIERCLSSGCKVRRYTPLQDVSSQSNQMQMKEISINDLLGRPEEVLEMTKASACFSEKTVLITGGGGSIGSELCRRLLPLNPEKVILYDISENYMYDLFNELRLVYGDHLKEQLILCVGSIQDPERLHQVFEQYRPQIVLHAAAHKHVPLMEDCPAQAVKNNVFGTFYTALAAIEHKVERFVLISTDKAVNPTNVMGATKRMAEMVVLALNEEGSTEFTAVRFGNVLGSHGSVVPLFERQIRAGGPVTLTHPDILRYFMTIPEAAGLVLQAAALAKGGELFVLDMGQPVRIRELAERMIQLYGPKDGRKIEIVYTGLRKGEKLYEELLLDTDGLKSTALQKIFVAAPEAIPKQEMLNMLDTLKQNIDNGGDMLQCMHELLPSFLTPEAVNAKAAELPK